MRARIHRGAHEIGGSCVEIEASTGGRILLDLGMPLGQDDHNEEPRLPEIPGLASPDPSLLGILISHAHQDHWGLVPAVPQDVPVLCGAAAEAIVKEAAFWTSGISFEASGHFRDREPFELGSFAITPFLADHSAFDAYSLLIEADGKKLFYTGDIRAHGRKSALFEALVRDAPTDVDALMMEGTHVGMGGEVIHGLASETAVEQACVETFRATPGLVLATFSAQNLDRLVSVFRAAKRSGREMVLDLYGASIAKASGNPNIPQAGFDGLRVFVPRWQQLRVKESGEFHRVEEIKECRIFEDEIGTSPEDFVFSFSMGSAFKLDKVGALAGARAVWSLWSGYLKEPSGKRYLNFLDEHSISLVKHHCSGHASIADLQRLAQAMDPMQLVPIHTFGASQFGDWFNDTVEHPDGEWWEV